MSSRSARLMTAPVGLFGKFSISTLVRGVTLASSMARVRRNPFSARVSTSTGTPCANRIVAR